MARKKQGNGCMGLILYLFGILIIICMAFYAGVAIIAVGIVISIICGIIKLVKKNKRERTEEVTSHKMEDNELEEKTNEENVIEAREKTIASTQKNNEQELSVSNKIDMYKNKIDYMTGEDFELFIAQILRKIGFYNVNTTKGSGDQGVDILAEKDGIKYAFQCKRYDKPVGNKAVQEVYAGMAFYRCHSGIVVTNNYFTQSAKELAKTNGISLWDRAMLEEIINISQIEGIENILYEKVDVSEDEVRKVAGEIINSFMKYNVYLIIKECFVDRSCVKYCFKPENGTRIKNVISCKEDVSLSIGTNIDMRVNYESGFIEMRIYNDFFKKFKEISQEKKGAENNNDEYFENAGKYIIDIGSVSIGGMMRELRIGFDRANKIMDELRNAGVFEYKTLEEDEKILMSMDDFENYMKRIKKST